MNEIICQICGRPAKTHSISGWGNKFCNLDREAVMLGRIAALERVAEAAVVVTNLWMDAEPREINAGYDWAFDAQATALREAGKLPPSA